MDRTQKEQLKDIRAFFLKGLSPQGGSFLVASIADLLSEGLSVDEIAALASFLAAISQIMSYIASQMELNTGSSQPEITDVTDTIT